MEKHFACYYAKAMIKKLTNGLGVLLVLLIPSQLGLHFWPEWSFIDGVRVDYFSPTIYVTDVLIFGLLLLFVVQRVSEEKRREFSIKKYGKTFIFSALFLLFVLVNVGYSYSPAVSIYKWIKVVEFGFLGWWTAQNLKFNVYSLQLATLLLATVFYESVLAIWQFSRQSSIGGMWYLLGERTFNSSTPGIANAFINGELVLRPYGTFSHPNVLGGFLGLTLPVALIHFLHNSRKFNAGRRLVVAGVMGIGLMALLLTLSRGAILFGALCFVTVFYKYSRQITKTTMALMVVVLVMAGTVIWPRLQALRVEFESIVVRQETNDVAIERWRQSPIFGTGLGTSPLYRILREQKARNYSLSSQPTHSIYLLVLAETGLIGFGLLAGTVFWAGWRLWRKGKILIFTPLLFMLTLGIFDHYWLTLQQGQLMFVLVLSVALRETGRLKTYNE